MTHKHTLGPWTQGSPDETDEYFYSINSEYASSPICRVNPQQDEDRAEANARLISAAPELLGALENVRKYVSPDMDTMDCEHIRSIIDAVIAKATGAE